MSQTATTTETLTATCPECGATITFARAPRRARTAGPSWK
jgi:hypothetical protein